MRGFGLTLIKVETAGGGGGPHHNNIMSMIGIIDAENFKTKILSQREQIIKDKFSFSAQPNTNVADTQLLTEIKNELIEIKLALKK